MKKGISLIVLIVTIIVIIILAAAVILTLNKNNPIDSSRVSQLADNRASMNSAIQLYYGKVMAETQGIFETEKIFLGGSADLNGTPVKIPKIVKDSTSDKIGNKFYKLSTRTSGSTNYVADVATVLTGDNPTEGVKSTESALDISIPSISGADWYVDITTGLVYLVYPNGANAAALTTPTWMYTDGATKKVMDSTLKEFVKMKNAEGTDIVAAVAPASN